MRVFNLKDLVRHDKWGLGEIESWGRFFNNEWWYLTAFTQRGRTTQVWVRQQSLELVHRLETADRETEPCAPNPFLGKCTCELYSMMRDGCQCGAMAAERAGR